MNVNKVNLGEICEINMGQAPPGSSYNESGDGYPLIAGAGDFGIINPEPHKYTDSPTKISKQGDIILCIRATIGNLNWADKKYCLGRGVAGLCPNKKYLEPNYLWWWLDITKNQLSQLGKGSTYKQISRQDIESYTIPLPQLSEQKRIAAILDKADAIRRKRQQAIKLADEFLRAVFLDMFGNVVKNTKNWSTACLGDVCKTRLGKMLDSKQQTGKYLRPYLRNANVLWNNLNLKDLFEMDFNEKDRKEFRLCYGDVLICEGGEVGRSAIWRDELAECYFQKAIHRIRPDMKKLIPEYLINLMWFYAKNGGFQDHVTSVTIPHLTGIKLKNMEIPLPPVQFQKKFSYIVNKLNLKKERLMKLDNIAGVLIKSLIQRAFRGEL
ncbi:MAG: restriction endonuclease [Desulfobacterales bacterium]|nr:restriction endonuclease [Desulfobacterales bacterium]